MVVPERLVRTVERLAQNFFICAPVVSQHAALAAFEATHELDQLRDVYVRNRAALVAALPQLGFDCSVPADGAFYLYANIAGMTDSASTFARRMLDEAGIATTARRRFPYARRFPGDRRAVGCGRGRARRTVHPLFLFDHRGRSRRGDPPPASVAGAIAAVATGTWPRHCFTRRAGIARVCRSTSLNVVALRTNARAGGASGRSTPVQRRHVKGSTDARSDR